MVLILSACSPGAEDTEVPGPETADPSSVVEAYYTAFNAGDVEGLEAILAEDLTVGIDFLGQSNTMKGRAAYLRQEAVSFAANAQIAFSKPSVSENTLEADHTYIADGEVLAGTIRF
jgi:ketosteroid isomerase-like protein